MDPSLDIWKWLILAMVFMGAGTFVPRLVLMWLGFAAIGMTVAVLLIPGLTLVGQVIVFILIAIPFLMLSRKQHKQKREAEAIALLETTAHGLIGQTFVLSRAIVNGRGKIIVKDHEWIAIGPDQPQSTKVKVVGIKGIYLRVERISETHKKRHE